MRIRALVLCFALFAGLFTCGISSRAQEPLAEQKIDFSVLAVMGDSLSQSYHSGVLHVDAQQNNYVRLFADKVGTELRQALVAEPGGYGDLFALIDPTIPVEPLNPRSFLNLTLKPANKERINPNVRVNNFAIGGAKVTDVINARPDPNNPNTALYAGLGLPWLFDNPPVRRSQLEFVETMNPKPTAVILFIGNNDALAAASRFDPSLLTPVDKFTQDYETIVRRTKATGAQLITISIVNVPLAAFIPGRDLSLIFRVEPKLFEQLTGIKPEDFVTLRSFPAIQESFKGAGPVPESLVARKSIVDQILKRLKEYNSAISKIAKREKVLFVKLDPMLKRLVSPNGIEIPGVARLSNRYFGGFFSLDGTHVTNTANALFANEVISAVNKFYGTKISAVDVVPIAKADPLVPKGTSFAPGLTEEPTLEEWMEAAPRLEAIGNATFNLFDR